MSTIKLHHHRLTVALITIGMATSCNWVGNLIAFCDTDADCADREACNSDMVCQAACSNRACGPGLQGFNCGTCPGATQFCTPGGFCRDTCGVSVQPLNGQFAAIKPLDEEEMDLEYRAGEPRRTRPNVAERDVLAA